MSQWITRNTVMNPNKEKISRLFKNIFRFILLVIVLDILLFLSVSEILGEIKDVSTIKKEMWKSLYIFTTFNVIYAIVLFPIFIKEKNIMKLKLHIIIMKQNDMLSWIELKKMMKYLYIMMNMKIKSTKKILDILKKKKGELHLYHMLYQYLILIRML